LTSALIGGEWSDSRSGRFTPGEISPGTHWIGSWVGPRTDLEDMEERKFLPLTGLDPLFFQPVASRYTDCAIPVPNNNNNNNNNNSIIITIVIVIHWVETRAVSDMWWRIMVSGKWKLRL
jgi:hypothetical protein